MIIFRLIEKGWPAASGGGQLARSKVKNFAGTPAADVVFFDAGRKLKEIFRQVTRDKIHHKAILAAAMDVALLLTTGILHISPKSSVNLAIQNNAPLIVNQLQ